MSKAKSAMDTWMFDRLNEILVWLLSEKNDDISAILMKPWHKTRKNFFKIPKKGFKFLMVWKFLEKLLIGKFQILF